MILKIIISVGKQFNYCCKQLLATKLRKLPISVAVKSKKKQSFGCCTSAERPDTLFRHEKNWNYSKCRNSLEISISCCFALQLKLTEAEQRKWCSQWPPSLLTSSWILYRDERLNTARAVLLLGLKSWNWSPPLLHSSLSSSCKNTFTSFVE